MPNTSKIWCQPDLIDNLAFSLCTVVPLDVWKKNIIMFFNQYYGRVVRQFLLRAIEPNVPRDDFSLIAIELTFVSWDTVLKTPVQSSMIFMHLGQRRFKSDYITRYLHTWVV